MKTSKEDNRTNILVIFLKLNEKYKKFKYLINRQNFNKKLNSNIQIYEILES